MCSAKHGNQSWFHGLAHCDTMEAATLPIRYPISAHRVMHDYMSLKFILLSSQCSVQCLHQEQSELLTVLNLIQVVVADATRRHAEFERSHISFLCTVYTRVVSLMVSPP